MVNQGILKDFVGVPNNWSSENPYPGERWKIKENNVTIKR